MLHKKLLCLCIKFFNKLSFKIESPTSVYTMAVADIVLSSSDKVTSTLSLGYTLVQID